MATPPPRRSLRLAGPPPPPPPRRSLRLARPPPPRRSLRLAGINLPPPPPIDGDEFEELDEVRDEARYEEEYAQDNIGSGVLEEEPDFHFSHSNQSWLPPVHHQGYLPICWAVSSAHQVAATVAFHHRDQVRLEAVFSPQSIIDGLPTLALPREIRMQGMPASSEYAKRKYYISSTYMGLSFVSREGIPRDPSYPLEGRFPYVGFYGDYRNFERQAEIYRPFKIPVNISSAAIRGVLERHGPLVGSFYCTEALYHCQPSEIYQVDPNTLVKHLVTHCVVVVGVGRRNGVPYLHIQNSYGISWGENGFGRVSLHLFHQLQGLRYACEHVG